mgnify:FL=1
MPVLILILLLAAPVFDNVEFHKVANTTTDGRVKERIARRCGPAAVNVNEEEERGMLELVNKERRAAGLNELVMDEGLVKVARLHSLDMWQRQYFAHENLDGESPFDRMEEGDVDFRRAGENLALARTLKRAHVGLMNSPGHRRNILDPSFNRIGIGVIDGGLYGKMFTQNFAD